MTDLKSRIAQIAVERGVIIKPYSLQWAAKGVTDRHGDGEIHDNQIADALAKLKQERPDQFGGPAEMERRERETAEQRLDRANSQPLPKTAERRGVTEPKPLVSDAGRAWLKGLSAEQRLDFAGGHLDPPRFVRVAEETAQQEKQ